ncbi:MAG: flagellar hook-basal body complex protein FliE [Pseudomonadota bacterium]
MSIDSLRAAQAYLNTVQQTGTTTASTPAPATGDTDPGSFAQLVQSAISDTSNSLSQANAAASGVGRGEADLVDVVTAISAAEISLETAIAVRNRMIEAYQEIMRMPI